MTLDKNDGGQTLCYRYLEVFGWETDSLFAGDGDILDGGQTLSTLEMRRILDGWQSLI